MTDTRLVVALVMQGAPGGVRPGLSAACAQAGWEYVEDWGEDLPDQAKGTSRLLVFAGGITHQLNADATVVIGPSPHVVIAACESLANGNWIEATRMASRFLAEASMMVSDGALFISTDAENIYIPHLGPVFLPAEGSPSTTDVPPVVADALAMYSPLLAVDRDGASWSPNFMLLANEAMTPYGGEVLDLTGRMRLVLFGPFIILPPGDWAVTVEMEIDPIGGSLHLGFDWGAGAEWESVNLAFDRPGVYRAKLRHHWLTAEAAQFRVWVKRAAFLGSFTLRTVQCARC